MRHIRRRGLALPLISGLAAVSMLLATSQAAATEDPAQRHRPAGHAKDRTTRHETHTVASGNTLWEIAADHYGDGTKWWVLFGANAKAIEQAAQDHGRDGSGIGHWIFPETELAVPDPAVMRAGEKAVRAALDRVLARHPQLLGGSLCPEAEAPEDIGDCFLGLLDRVPLLLEHLDFPEGVSSSELPELLELLELPELPELSELSELLELLEPLVTCVMEEEDPITCLTEAMADLPAQG
ncbi:LysM peptidoglycan-binding domain-containing protein [Streptomyces sp. NPDC018964]|uniref:LysM peptidoglycan-binding domain-containing protein n=1 Tax=unclassified Streptomyces TaxID=2593676 RepID=UPI0037B2907D